jgi:hypothetical protein
MATTCMSSRSASSVTAVLSATPVCVAFAGDSPVEYPEEDYGDGPEEPEPFDLHEVIIHRPNGSWRLPRIHDASVMFAAVGGRAGHPCRIVR